MGDGKFRIVLHGHFQLYSPEGVELAVDGLGEKSKGFLAILALRPGQPVARTYIQDKLWSDRGEVQGRNSLKQSLRQIRNLFKDHGHDVIRTNGGPIVLDKDQVWIDHFDQMAAPFQGEFLEGIDIKDPQFNIWLNMMRTGDAQAPAAAVPFALDPSSTPQQRVIGVMPVMCEETDTKAKLIGNIFVDRVINALSFYELYGVQDFRLTSTDGGRGCDYLLTAQSIGLGDDVSISFSLNQSADNRRLCGHQILLEPKELTSDRLAQLTVQVGDRLAHCIDSNSFLLASEERDAAKLVMEGIDRLFRPSKETTREAVSAFEQACAIEPKSSYLAWLAYSGAHLLEVGNDRDRAEVLDRTEMLAARALENDPYNPLTRILLTHVYSFIFRDLERADSLIGPLHQSPPDTPLYYYFLGCLRNYQNDLEAARKAAFKARDLGRYSPYAHLFSSLATMTASMSGDFETAIRMGEEALVQQPLNVPAFGPTLRYLATAYVGADKLGEAGRIYDLIKAQSPAFEAKQILTPEFPVPVQHARKVLHSAFSRIELAR